MNASVLSQIRTRKTPDAPAAQGQKEVKVHHHLEVTLQNLCLQYALRELRGTTKASYQQVFTKYYVLPQEIRINILQNELTDYSLTILLHGIPFTVFITPRNHDLTDSGASFFAPMCTHLTMLDVRTCRNISMAWVLKVVEVCGRGLLHLDFSGQKGDNNPDFCGAMTKVLEHTPNLLFLGVRDTNQNFSAINFPRYCSKLVYLELSYSHGYSTMYLSALTNNLPSLVWLNLSWCSGIDDACVIAVMQQCGSRLIALNVEMCCTGGVVTDKGVLEVAQQCPNLEHFSSNNLKLVSDKSICELVRRCTNLKSLHISGCEITDTSINEIAASCPKLENISLAGLHDITDMAVTKIFKQCEQLECIDLANCSLISPTLREKFIRKILFKHPSTGAAYIH